MNKIYTQLLALLAIAGIGNEILGSYEYDFQNMIGDPIVLKINQSRTDKKDYYQILFPGKTVKQTFPMGNAYCLAPNGLQWAPYDKSNPFNGGADFINQTTLRIPEERQREFGDKIAPHYTFLPVEIRMLPNAAYREMANSATKLLKGIDTFACQTIETAKAFTNPIPGMGGGSSGGSSGASKPSASNKNAQTLELLEQLQTTIASIKDINSSEQRLNRAKVKNAIEALISKENIKLLTDIAKIAPIDIAAIKNAMANDASQAKALSIINAALNNFIGAIAPERPSTPAPTTKPTEPTPPNSPLPALPEGVEPYKATTDESTVKTSIDVSNSYPSLSSSMNSSSMNSSMGGSSQPSKSGNCSFGLGRIGKEAGNLARTTMCASRPFTIYYKTDENDLPIIDKYGRPVLVADTIEGQ